jgi:hypothetical protein
VQAPPGDSLPPEATGAGMEETKCLKPSASRKMSEFFIYRDILENPFPVPYHLSAPVACLPKLCADLAKKA